MDHGYRVPTIELCNLRALNEVRSPPRWDPELRGVCGHRAAPSRDRASPLDHERPGPHREGDFDDDPNGRLGPGGWPPAQPRRGQAPVAFQRGRCPV